MTLRTPIVPRTLSRLDFSRQGAPLSGWRLALLGAGLLALAAAGAAWTVQARASARLEAQLALARPPAPTRVALSPTRQRELDQQGAIVAEAVRQLNLPVTRLIKTVQPPPDIRVALLGLDVNGKSEADGAARGNAGGLKIGAEAETAQDMMNYVAFLNEQPLFASVYLVKHEIDAGTPDHAYRFQLEVQWRE